MPITRRAALSTVPLAMAATSLSGSAFAQARNPARPGAAGARQAPGFYRYKVGDIEITAINDGYFQIPLDGLVKNAELQNVQQAAQEAFLSPSAFPIAFTSLVVNRGGRLDLDRCRQRQFRRVDIRHLDGEFPRRRPRSGECRNDHHQPFPR